MKAKIVAVMACAMLAGCTNYAEMATRPATHVATTNKTPQGFAICMLPKLLDTNAASHVVAHGNMRQIVVPVGGGTPDAVLMTFDATPVIGATRVEMRHMPSLSNFDKQWQQAESCL